LYGLGAVFAIGLVRLDNSQLWALEQDRKPVVTIDDDKVHVQNVRDFTWRTATDYDIGWYKRTYDLTKLNSMHYIVAPMRHWEAVASVFVSFGFSDGQQVANPWRDIDSTAALTASSRQCSVSFN
jgi:hypothetical protein